MNLQIFRNLKFKIMMLSLFSLVPIIMGLIFYVLPLFKEYLIEQKKNEIKVAVKVVADSILQVEQLEKDQLLKHEEAEARIKDLVRKARFNETDYFFTYTSKGFVTAHGIKPEMEGQDRSESADAHGKKYVKEFMLIADKKSDGFVNYMFEKEKGGNPFEKISYVKYIPSLDWVLGTGIYVDNLDDYISKIRTKILMGLLLISLFSLLISFVLSKKVADKIVGISDKITDETERVAEVAVDIATASENLSFSSSQHASALQQTTSSLEQTSTMISKNAENASSSLKIANESQENAFEGKNRINTMIQSMADINLSYKQMQEQFDQNNIELAEIVKIIHDIENKTKIINEIVFQTKLLSFNASVEAARAGEHGKGFAVVAEEIGSLAQLSGQSAQEITTLLTESINKVEQTIVHSKHRFENILKSSNDKVQNGTLYAQQCNEIFEHITENVQKMNQMITEISTASNEQSVGVSEINKAMAELDNVSQKNNNETERAAQAAKDLKTQVETLKSMTEELHETVLGSA